MAILGKLAVLISANTAEFNKNLGGLTKSINKFTGTIGGASKALAGLFFVDQLSSFGKAIFDVTAQFQTFEVTLTNTLGSKSAAKRALDEVRQFATETPFAVAEVSAAYTRWANQGLTPTIDKMRKLGDVASALGGGFEQTAEAFKDLAVGQTKRIEELGILATQQNGKIQLSFKGVNLEIDKNAEGVQKALDVYSKLPGVLGTTAAVSSTLAGKWSNLKDNFDATLLSIGTSSSGLIGGFLDLSINVLQKFNGAIDQTIPNLVTERAELSLIIKALQDTNISKEQELRLRQQLAQKAPEIFKNLDVEKSKLEDVVKAGEKQLTVLSKRIELANSEKRLTTAKEKLNKLQDEEFELLLKKTEIQEKLKTTDRTQTQNTYDQNGALIGVANTYDLLINQLNSFEASLKKNGKQQDIEQNRFEKYTEFVKNKVGELDELDPPKPNPDPEQEKLTNDQLKALWDERLKSYQDFIDKINAINNDPAKQEKKVGSAFQKLISKDLLPSENEINNIINGYLDKFAKITEVNGEKKKILIPTGIKIEKPDQAIADSLNNFADSAEQLGAAQDVVETLNKSFKQAAEDGLMKFGQALGQVFTGDMKFGDALLIGIKSFLKTFSKLLIGYAIASDAFKKAFENPYVALAAGIALSAIAGAINKTGTTGVNSISSSRGGFESSMSNGFSSNINITGKLVGSGRDLVAVIGNTAYDNSYTKIG